MFKMCEFELQEFKVFIYAPTVKGNPINIDAPKKGEVVILAHPDDYLIVTAVQKNVKYEEPVIKEGENLEDWLWEEILKPNEEFTVTKLGSLVVEDPRLKMKKVHDYVFWSNELI